jgi:hypothetical protein
MENDLRLIKDIQIKHFGDLYEKFKGTPMAVSSESIEHKYLRYKNIAGIFGEDNNFSIHDVGMGLADFYEYINKEFTQKVFAYSGSDILPDFVNEAKKKYPSCNFYLRNIAETIPSENYDYVIMSGLFHQKREIKIKEWEYFSHAMIFNAYKMAAKGIAFNFVSPFVDFYQPEVYYCKLDKLLNFITDRLSRFFVLKHDYALYEFTVFVYKEEYIHSQFKQKEFQKYFKS